MSQGVLESQEIAAAGPIDPARRKRGMLFLGLAVGCVGFALTVQIGLNANFLVDTIKVTPFQMGLSEAIRESCGVLAFGVLAVLAGLAEPLVGALMLVLMALGLGAYAYVPNFYWVIAMSVVWSQGVHVWMPLPSSITLSLAEPGRAGHRLGQMAAAGAVGSGLGLIVAYVLSQVGGTIRQTFLMAGAAGLLGALACLGIPRDLKTPGPRLVVRRRYGLYYLLCFLEGWRKQIFLCFAPFLLVNVHHTEWPRMLLLWGVIQVVSYLAAPRVGRLIDCVGERPTLMGYYATVVLVFIGYAFVPNLHALYFLFVLDSVIFLFNTATTTYVNRIAPPAEHTSTLSAGVAANHVAAVSMPLAGGILWTCLGPRWTFLAGAAAAVLSVIAATFVPRREITRS